MRRSSSASASSTVSVSAASRGRSPAAGRKTGGPNSTSKPPHLMRTTLKRRQVVSRSASDTFAAASTAAPTLPSDASIIVGVLSARRAAPAVILDVLRILVKHDADMVGHFEGWPPDVTDHLIALHGYVGPCPLAHHVDHATAHSSSRTHAIVLRRVGHAPSP